MEDKTDMKDIESKVKIITDMNLHAITSEKAAEVLYDCNYDVQRAIDRIMEGDLDDSAWTTVESRQKPKDDPKLGKGRQRHPDNANDQNHNKPNNQNGESLATNW